MRVNHQENGCQLQAKTVTVSGSVPDAITDLFADALLQFILAVEQEAKEKEKSA